jgi:diadenosine tetraphosphate (Ap4A) HIT family hydrolase
MKKKHAAHRTASATCPLCRSTGGSVIWRDRDCRVVVVRDPDYAGYCRVIWNAHVREMTDLTVTQRAHCMRVVFAVEKAQRMVFAAHKINLASFGNMAPHLHWHVIPRFARDAHFPNPVWGKRLRRARVAAPAQISGKWRSMLKQQLAQLL